MAETASIAARPMRMSLATGVKALVTGAAAEAGGQQSLTLAFVAGSFVLAAAIIGPIVTESVRQWLRKTPPPTAVDHDRELIYEQAELAAMRTIDHLLDTVEERDKQLAARDAEITRLRRRRRD